MIRRRFFRELLIVLECGHEARLNTSRYRVGKATAAILLGDHARKGVWCFPCNACCSIIEFRGVVRQG